MTLNEKKSLLSLAIPKSFDIWRLYKTRNLSNVLIVSMDIGFTPPRANTPARTHAHTHTHTHTHNIYIYICKNFRQRSSFASSKVFIRWCPWVQGWFRGRSFITTNPGCPSSISQYRVPQQYLTILPDFIGWCLICTNAISVQMQLQPCLGSFLYNPSSLLV